MRASTYFYASRADFNALMDLVEADETFVYLVHPDIHSPELSTYDHARDIPDVLRMSPGHAIRSDRANWHQPSYSSSAANILMGPCSARGSISMGLHLRAASSRLRCSDTCAAASAMWAVLK